MLPINIDINANWQHFKTGRKYLPAVASYARTNFWLMWAQMQTDTFRVINMYISIQHEVGLSFVEQFLQLLL